MNDKNMFMKSYLVFVWFPLRRFQYRRKYGVDDRVTDCWWTGNRRSPLHWGVILVSSWSNKRIVGQDRKLSWHTWRRWKVSARW